MDVGDIVRVQQGQFATGMLIGRVIVESIDTFEIEWHLVELPTQSNVTFVDSLAWYADDPDSILGVNTYLTDEFFQRGQLLTIGGRYLTIDGDMILIPTLDLIAIDDDFLSIDSAFVQLGLTNGN